MTLTEHHYIKQDLRLCFNIFEVFINNEPSMYMPKVYLQQSYDNDAFESVRSNELGIYKTIEEAKTKLEELKQEFIKEYDKHNNRK